MFAPDLANTLTDANRIIGQGPQRRCVLYREAEIPAPLDKAQFGDIAL